MAVHGKVASRYAQALLDAAKNEKDARELANELLAFSRMVGGHSELTIVLSSQLFSVSKRRAVLEDLVKSASLSNFALKALLVVNEQGRLSELAVIAEKLHTLILEKAGIVPLKVLSASEVAKEDRQHLETKFSKLLGKSVEASYEIQASLVAGVKVLAGGKTYDGSVAGWLQSFEEQLVGGNI